MAGRAKSLFMELEKLAESLYQTYCHAVGGKAFNGDPLPDWNTFRADPAKQKQSDAWVEAAKTALFHLNGKDVRQAALTQLAPLLEGGTHPDDERLCFIHRILVNNHPEGNFQGGEAINTCKSQ